ncbi:HGxxPAAW family protein [Actinopolymorpha sp. B9G3]|uniref:HGxxPAAW family protein n=1 Tax=unclassified Actinopolymorpha TaxID=2627063 RepID=UPI0032D94BD2
MSDAPGGSIHPGHGNSPAAWTTVTIIFLGSVVAGVAVVMAEWWLFFVGAVGVPLVGLVIGKILSSAGLGTGRPPRYSAEDVAHAGARKSQEEGAETS